MLETLAATGRWTVEKILAIRDLAEHTAEYVARRESKILRAPESDADADHGEKSNQALEFFNQALTLAASPQLEATITKRIRQVELSQGRTEEDQR